MRRVPASGIFMGIQMKRRWWGVGEHWGSQEDRWEFRNANNGTSNSRVKILLIPLAEGHEEMCLLSSLMPSVDEVITKARENLHVSSISKVERSSRYEEETRDLAVREGRAFQEEKSRNKGVEITGIWGNQQCGDLWVCGRGWLTGNAGWDQKLELASKNWASVLWPVKSYWHVLSGPTGSLQSICFILGWMMVLKVYWTGGALNY